jgi:hypothetical protein
MSYRLRRARLSCRPQEHRSEAVSFMELINSFFAGSRWVWVTILVIGAMAIAVRVLGW